MSLSGKMMRDVQNESDDREIKLDRVGVNHVVYPIQVKDKDAISQHSVGIINLYVDLPKEFRGTHMSRFIEILNKYQNQLSYSSLESILDETKKELNAETAHIEIEFTYFIKKNSPVSKISSYMSYLCKFLASKKEKFDFTLEVNVPIQLVCPCSREISAFGAHNQRGVAKISLKMNHLVWIEDLVEIGEKAGSSPLYTLLKREDEKFITEESYQNAKFVEDVVRDIVLPLEKDSRITWFSVSVLSQESIHNHNAYASVSRHKTA
jgi:GTP cyclohydrolase I